MDWLTFLLGLATGVVLGPTLLLTVLWRSEARHRRQVAARTEARLERQEAAAAGTPRQSMRGPLPSRNRRDLS